MGYGVYQTPKNFLQRRNKIMKNIKKSISVLLLLLTVTSTVNMNSTILSLNFNTMALDKNIETY